ncbi:hypothetical protein CC1G_13953 [Coprinopsis cinerea okayama7|uniref:Uncharacterized protein n=1 Tax=Coprinopsis cinerea (strain Okayama-7 / 130 / ATCC MYA-4618 / FGSC 9003) TaxID=240176 RepID=D6RKY3_COPC7|nr:hypothetical protein CC1G_13953 [Coprinopsis cinerea okayama7\|eukprot:XP_002911913.1 hypothetical protein CC1G_13953 [Coprinopsis cinerea okayama7\
MRNDGVDQRAETIDFEPHPVHSQRKVGHDVQRTEGWRSGKSQARRGDAVQMVTSRTSGSGRAQAIAVDCQDCPWAAVDIPEPPQARKECAGTTPLFRE